MVRNNQNEKVTFYYSRYAYKSQELRGMDIVYQGGIPECPKEKIEGVKMDKGHKYVRVWK